MKRKSGQDPAITRNWKPATLAIRGGTARSDFGETSEAIFMTSGYSYENAEEAAARFRGDTPGMTYSRLQNPTVEMLEKRIALMEGAESCRATASGMAAMSVALLSMLSAGDHMVAGKIMFGSNRWLTDTLFPRYGIEVTLVDSHETAQWEAAVRPNTKVFFFETPANPSMQISDIQGICDIARAHGIISIVDNAFATSALQRPMEMGADVVCYSATKLMDGQGRVLAGAICSSEQMMTETILPFHRNVGATLSPFNAWVVLKGLETLDLRAQRQSENAMKVAQFLEGRVKSVLYPGLESHPHHKLAMQQMVAAGPIFSILLGGGRKEAHGLLDGLNLIDISNNIGDSRSLMTHPSSTTHFGMSEEARLAVGITEDMIRVNIGLEDADDLIADLDQALTGIGL